MCLYKFGKFNTRKKIGFKIFNDENHYLSSYIRGSMKRLPVGKWLNEKDYRDKTDFNMKYLRTEDKYENYKFGWHIYYYKSDENYFSSWCVKRKVKFRKIVAKGYQDGKRIVVAKEIYIIPLKKMKK